MRPIDLARAHGLSTQAVRNYESAGILPPAERTPSGYRSYTRSHAFALRTFLALVPGHGHSTATAIMVAVNDGTPDVAFALIDGSHLQLVRDRETLDAVERALADLTDEDTGIDLGGEVSVGTMANRMSLRPATLRNWERAGLLAPARDPRTGYRIYRSADIRDADLIHQLRRGGYLLAQIAPVIGEVRAAGGTAKLHATVGAWRERLDARARAMLDGAARLSSYLELLSGSP